MTHDSKGPGESGSGPAPGAQPGPEAGPAPQPSAAPDAAAPPGSAVPTEADMLKSEVAELKDKLLRAHAEMDNMRKRFERERAEASKYAITRFARDIVTVGDNFQRAMAALPAGALEQSPALKSFVDGITMTERELINVLERNGIRRIDPAGQPFNPHHHQAVMEQPNTDLPAGTVMTVLQPGYLIEERILRPAMVVVAKGGSKPEKPVEPAANGSAPPPPAPANDDPPPGPAASG